MAKCLLISLVFLFMMESGVRAQCTTLGQNPETAFPVCGTTSFFQANVPLCSSNNLYVPGCSGNETDYENKNPFWYKFTCYQAGTLGFVITPNTPSDDYDWQLYDITGRNPTAIYTDNSLVVTGNWSATPGNTGASASGVDYLQCASSPAQNRPTFARMPNLVLNHEYILLVSHFTNTQSGYSLSFGGGTASITDPKLPKMQSSTAICDGSEAVITMNKKMRCNSLSSGEFSISPALATVTSATGLGCNTGFDLEQIKITLSTPLPPGTYQIKINNGSDGNTLSDYCENDIPENDSLELVVLQLQPTPMDSLVIPGCSPQTLELVFDKPMRCTSIAADGSDFVVTGTYPVTVTGARGNCVNGVTSNILVQLSAPLQTAGNFTIRLQAGSDGNTIIDECGQVTPPGFPLPFTIKDTVSADFSTSIRLACEYDTVQYSHNGANTVNSWLWNFDGLFTSQLQNPLIVYNTFGNHQTQLIVSNGTCSDTMSKLVFLRNTLKAKFDATLLVCPDDSAVFKDLSGSASPGNSIIGWSWTFSNGNVSNLQSPPPQYYIDGPVNYYAPVRLIVEDFLGCKDTTTINLNILNNCYIDVPTAFTPNGDGLNDFLYPLNAYKATNLRFSVFNRLGQRVFYTEDWTRQWDGKFKGQGADPATYVWVLDYYNLQTKKQIFKKGYTVLIR